MRRWLSLLLLIMLPLQANWAALSAYYQHKQGITAVHLSYHITAPQHWLGKNKSSEHQTLSATHKDCGCCHICLLSLPAEGSATLHFTRPTQWPMLSSPALVFRPTAPPERPNWLNTNPLG